MAAEFDGTLIIYPMEKSVMARGFEGCKLAIKDQAPLINVTILSQWAPVEVKMTLSVLWGVEEVLVIGSYSMRERLGVDVTTSVRDIMVRGAKERRIFPAVMVIKVMVASMEAQVLNENRVPHLGKVMVRL